LLLCGACRVFGSDPNQRLNLNSPQAFGTFAPLVENEHRIRRAGGGIRHAPCDQHEA
jgi:hypothetical protein